MYKVHSFVWCLCLPKHTFSLKVQWIGRIGRARASQFAALDLGAFAIFGSDSNRYLSLNNGKASASRTSDVPEPVTQEQNISRQVKGSEKDR